MDYWNNKCFTCLVAVVLIGIISLSIRGQKQGNQEIITQEQTQYKDSL